MFPSRVETDRLRMERFDEATGVDEAYEYFGRDESVEEELRYVTQTPDDTPKETFDRLREAEEEWNEAESALYAVFPKEGEEGAGELAGDAKLSMEWDRGGAILGVRFRKRFWGRGYSGERAAAMLVLAFDHLDLDVVWAGAAEGNEKSRRAIQKYADRFGGRYDGVIRHWVPLDEGVADIHNYSITREEFEENREAAPEVTIHDG